LLTIDNEVKLGDLGFGKFIGGSNAFSLAGTPSYMSPEQSKFLLDDTSAPYSYPADIW